MTPDLARYGNAPTGEGTRLPDWTIPRPIENRGSVGNLAQIHARDNAGHDTVLTFEVLRQEARMRQQAAARQAMRRSWERGYR